MPEQSSNGVRNHIEAKMSKVANVLTKVHSGLKCEPMYTTFLKFTINDFTLLTTSRDPIQNIMQSFEIEKNGTGKANNFTIRIAYGPDIGDTDGRDWDINLLDSLLEKTVNPEVGAEFSTRTCKLQYGYAYLNGEQLIDEEYTGMVLDYTVELSEGMLLYTITGYSSIVYFNELKEDIATPNVDNEGKGKPTEVVKGIVEDKLSGMYVCKADGDIIGSDVAVSLPAQLDKNISSAITEILGYAVHESQSIMLEDGSQIPAEEVITYDWFVEDKAESDNEGTLWIIQNDPKADTDKQPDADVVFNWMTPAKDSGYDHIVISFKPEFSGKVRLAKAVSLLNPKKEDGSLDEEATDENLLDGSYFLDDNGALQYTHSTTTPQTGGDIETVALNNHRDRSGWVHDIQYPYKATMVTVGIPITIPITGRIGIHPMIYGKEHHSAGVYQINSTVDSIDGGGAYTTTWNLMKLDGFKK